MFIIPFLRPTLTKLILFALLIALASFIPDVDEVCSPSPGGISCGSAPISGIGYPTFYGEGFEGDVKMSSIFYPISFLVNIVVYYLLAATAVWLAIRSSAHI